MKTFEFDKRKYKFKNGGTFKGFLILWYNEHKLRFMRVNQIEKYQEINNLRHWLEEEDFGARIIPFSINMKESSPVFKMARYDFWGLVKYGTKLN